MCVYPVYHDELTCAKIRNEKWYTDMLVYLTTFSDQLDAILF